MSMLSGLFGHATDIDPKKIEAEFTELLVEGEKIQHAYRLVRDLIVFTNLRLFIVDVQGLTGKKKQYTAIPYRSIDYFSKETAGHFDWDAEIKIFVKSRATPIALEFKKDAHVHDVFRILSRSVLGRPSTSSETVALQPYEDPYEKWVREQKQNPPNATSEV